MNGQRNRLRTAYLLGEIIQPEVAIESGSYLGTTTQYLTAIAATKTYSIEINPRFSGVAKNRLKLDVAAGRVTIIDGNSAEKLPLILKELDPKETRILAYLDAHWLEYIPLHAELEALITWGGDFAAIIDDFYIPTDEGYGFDQYENHRVDISHVPSNSGVSVWIPSEGSATESGACRGTAYVFSASLLEKISNHSEKLKLQPYQS